MNISKARHPINCFLAFFCLIIIQTIAIAAPSNQLRHIDSLQLPDGNLKITFTFDRALDSTQTISSFMTKSPPRLILDLNNIGDHLASKIITLNSSLARRLLTTQSQDRTRIVIDLKDSAVYTTTRQDKTLVLDLVGSQTPVTSQPTSVLPTTNNSNNQFKQVDFKRTPGGGGQVIIQLANSNTEVDLEQKGSTIQLTFLDTFLPDSIKTRMDVTDFGTPVTVIEMERQKNNIRMLIQPHGKFTHLAYQTGSKFILDVDPITENDNHGNALRTNFTGDKVSLNFQSIDVRSVLQLLAEFTGLNIVTDDAVTGSMTLHLQNVPWDQALSIILKTRGLAERQIGNVILIAPADAVAEREQADLQSKSKLLGLSPLHSELVQINYASAKDLVSLLNSQQANLLSQRGKMSQDPRTNTIWIQESADKIDEIRTLIKQLDVPIRQVSIEARIISVTKKGGQDLGISFGVTKPQTTLSGTFAGANAVANAPTEIAAMTEPTHRMNVNLPAMSTSQATNDYGAIGLALANLGHGFLLDLELQALETEGQGEVIASPHLITANQHTATIESGSEVPFQQSTSSGAASIAFKKAALSLEVTPQITPNDKVVLKINIHNDSVSNTIAAGTTTPIILTENLATEVLVENGGTIVLGGIYKRNQDHSVSRIPFLHKIPLLGNLFQKSHKADDQSELLIFITPKIINTQLARI